LTTTFIIINHSIPGGASSGLPCWLFGVLNSAADSYRKLGVHVFTTCPRVFSTADWGLLGKKNFPRQFQHAQNGDNADEHEP
jgi:hypothetical protein